MTDPPRRRYAARLPREERRELILDAAMQVIAHEGFAAATIARVADQAAIAKSVLYNIFGDAETLQHELMQREQARAFAVAERALASGGQGDPLTGLRDGLLVLLDSVAEHPDTWRIVFLPAAGNPPRVAEAIRAGREHWRRALEPLVAERLATIGITEIDTELAAHLIRGNAEYLARLVIEHPETYDRERIRKFVDALT